jgi:hypothetical protein
MIGVLLLAANWRDLRKRTRDRIARALATDVETPPQKTPEPEVALV